MNKEKAPTGAEMIYRRFKVKASSDEQKAEFEKLVTSKNLSRADLKLILKSIEINPEFSDTF